MLVCLLLSKAIEAREIETLYKARQSIGKAINKHARKILRLKLFLSWENKYEGKRIKLFFIRLITLDLTRNKNELIISINRLDALVEALEKGTREYLKAIKNS